jgi:acylphosphatase
MSSQAADSARQVCRRCVVSGRVQGVFYRASSQQQARRLGVVGHAHNKADGSVEVLACGDENAVLRLIEWLWIGPSAAKVANVAVEIVELEVSAWPREFRTF